MKYLRLILAACTLGFLFSCSGGGTASLKTEPLFKLSIGKMEDQLDLFQFPDTPSTEKTRLFMKNGLFYISNGNSNKIMEFTSYGDILTLIYNQDQNPQPITLTPAEKGEWTSNRRAYPFPFQQVGDISVMNEREIIAEDKLPDDRQVYDEELEVVLDSILVRFDKDGKMIDYLGQEGVGGAPFPYIERIEVNNRDEIIVFTRTVKSWIVFWFSSDGGLLYKDSLILSDLPLLDVKTSIPSLDTIIADPSDPILYLKIDYYGNTITRQSGTETNIDFYKSRIYSRDVRKKLYTGAVDIPKVYIDREGSGSFDEKRYEVLYELLGIAKRDCFFLLAPKGNDSFELLIMDKTGETVERRRITLKDKDLVFRTFHLSREGILSALICKEYEAQVVWWRSDRLIEGRQEEQ
jgi:hypothetical protein